MSSNRACGHRSGSSVCILPLDHDTRHFDGGVTWGRNAQDAIPNRVCHCGRPVESRDPDPWEGRMDDYCYDCATCRCDTADAVCPHATPNRVRAEDFTHSFLMCEKTGELSCNTKSPPQPFCPTHRSGACLRIYVPLSEVQDA